MLVRLSADPPKRCQTAQRLVSVHMRQTITSGLDAFCTPGPLEGRAAQQCQAACVAKAYHYTAAIGASNASTQPAPAAVLLTLSTCPMLQGRGQD